MDLSTPDDESECLNDQDSMRDCESSTKSVPDGDNDRMRRVLEKATQHKEMGPEYLHQGNLSVFICCHVSSILTCFISI